MKTNSYHLTHGFTGRLYVYLPTWSINRSFLYDQMFREIYQPVPWILESITPMVFPPISQRCNISSTPFFWSSPWGDRLPTSCPGLRTCEFPRSNGRIKAGSVPSWSTRLAFWKLKNRLWNHQFFGGSNPSRWPLVDLGGSFTGIVRIHLPRMTVA